ncbi:hypothetical protein V6N13_060800 [Hibiscus sabdariffa]
MNLSWTVIPSGGGDPFGNRISCRKRKCSNRTNNGKYKSQPFNMADDLFTFGEACFAIHGEVLAIVCEEVVAAKPTVFEQMDGGGDDLVTWPGGAYAASAILSCFVLEIGNTIGIDPKLFASKETIQAYFGYFAIDEPLVPAFLT